MASKPQIFENLIQVGDPGYATSGGVVLLEEVWWERGGFEGFKRLAISDSLSASCLWLEMGTLSSASGSSRGARLMARCPTGMVMTGNSLEP